MRLYFLITFIITVNVLTGQPQKREKPNNKPVCELPLEEVGCITINDSKPLFINYNNPFYKGFVVVEGSLDTTKLLFTGKKILGAQLSSKKESLKRLNLDFGDEISKEKYYLIKVLPDLNIVLARVKFKFVRHNNCITYTTYRFRVLFN